MQSVENGALAITFKVKTLFSEIKCSKTNKTYDTAPCRIKVNSISKHWKVWFPQDDIYIIVYYQLKNQNYSMFRRSYNVHVLSETYIYQ